jgi:hypothetical protein
MRIQHDTTLTMDLQVEIALPNAVASEAEHAEPQVVVLPTGGDGGIGSLAHRWSFTPEEAEQLGRVLQDAAQRARDMT